MPSLVFQLQNTIIDCKITDRGDRVPAKYSVCLAFLAALGLAGCNQISAACSSFPEAGGDFDVRSFYPPQFEDEAPRKIAYEDVSVTDPVVRKAASLVMRCYQFKPHEEFKDDAMYMNFVHAVRSPDDVYYLVYDFRHITDVRIIFEVDKDGTVLRSMTGGMV